MDTPFNLTYLVERFVELFEAAEFYITQNDIQYTYKAIKQLKKNPTLRTFINSTKNVGVKHLNVKSFYGDISFEFKNMARGIGEREGSKFVIKWVGPHEAYNKVKDQK